MRRWLQIQRNRLHRWALEGLAGGQFYGAAGTIHHTGAVNVERDPDTGEVVAVWFRCAMLPFTDDVVDAERARQVKDRNSWHGQDRIRGIVFEVES